MPARTHFGELPARYEATRVPDLFRSNNLGGLTRFWSASLFEFLTDDFSDWPIGGHELSRFYRMIADAIGISGRKDGLDRLFNGNYVNRPPIDVLPAQQALVDRIEARKDPNVLAGVNRLGIATREDDPHRCVSCGECFSGCFRGAIFDAHTGIRRLFAEGAPRIINKRVERIEADAHSRTVFAGGERFGGYEKVFLAAGCIGTTEIVLRSLGIRNTAFALHDNPMILFPILGHRLHSFAENRDYVAIANHVIGLRPLDKQGRYAHILVNPVPDLALRNFLPPMAWRASRNIGNVMRSIVSIAKLYLHSSFGAHHRIYIDGGDELRIEQDPRPPDIAQERAAQIQIGAALKGTGFYTPFFPWIRTPTSAHYAGTLPYGNRQVPFGRGGEFLPGVHICDSAAFPAAPAQPLTFTIMANAMRTAREAIGE